MVRGGDWASSVPDLLVAEGRLGVALDEPVDRARAALEAAVADACRADPWLREHPAAVEWWATLLEEGRPATIVGTSFLTFTPDGLVATARDYWFLEPGTHQPFEDWGRQLSRPRSRARRR
jgi:hypothetical protein